MRRKKNTRKSVALSVAVTAITASAAIPLTARAASSELSCDPEVTKLIAYGGSKWVKKTEFATGTTKCVSVHYETGSTFHIYAKGLMPDGKEQQFLDLDVETWAGRSDLGLGDRQAGITISGGSFNVGGLEQTLYCSTWNASKNELGPKDKRSDYCNYSDSSPSSGELPAQVGPHFFPFSYSVDISALKYYDDPEISGPPEQIGDMVPMKPVNYYPEASSVERKFEVSKSELTTEREHVVAGGSGSASLGNKAAGSALGVSPYFEWGKEWEKSRESSISFQATERQMRFGWSRLSLGPTPGGHENKGPRHIDPRFGASPLEPSHDERDFNLVGRQWNSIFEYADPATSANANALRWSDPGVGGKAFGGQPTESGPEVPLSLPQSATAWEPRVGMAFQSYDTTTEGKSYIRLAIKPKAIAYGLYWANKKFRNGDEYGKGDNDNEESLYAPPITDATKGAFAYRTGDVGLMKYSKEFSNIKTDQPWVKCYPELNVREDCTRGDQLEFVLKIDWSSGIISMVGEGSSPISGWAQGMADLAFQRQRASVQQQGSQSAENQDKRRTKRSAKANLPTLCTWDEPSKDHGCPGRDSLEHTQAYFLQQETPDLPRGQAPWSAFSCYNLSIAKKWCPPPSAS
ncbi:hypothetical protein [Streptomyces sp. NPDC046161]|uniref:hypothetical protein n=1 Tax=Streptomyces sp. NPDC046161 TaxID=3155132 RepID=UPI003409F0BF